jgi:hypothetical protein
MSNLLDIAAAVKHPLHVMPGPAAIRSTQPG